jgi:hypothetical protein
MIQILQVLLTVLSAAIWWVIYSSMAAAFSGLIVWAALRFLEKTPIVFNRVYMATLIWALISFGINGLILATQLGHALGQTPGASILTLPWVRAAMVLNMFIGAFLVWRLVPRGDARRVKPTSACAAVALVTVVSTVLILTVHHS